MKAVPIELKQANAFVEKLHRHHLPVHRDKFRIGCLNDNNELCGVIQCGRPLSRYLDDGKTLEVVRCCTDGTYNACSFLYSRAARIAKEMGYDKIITYILESEDGASLKASGWYLDADNVDGVNWNVPSRPRDIIEQQLTIFGESKPKYPSEKKKRWAKLLKENDKERIEVERYGRTVVSGDGQ